MARKTEVLYKDPVRFLEDAARHVGDGQLLLEMASDVGVGTALECHLQLPVVERVLICDLRVKERLSGRVVCEIIHWHGEGESDYWKFVAHAWSMAVALKHREFIGRLPPLKSRQYGPGDWFFRNLSAAAGASEAMTPNPPPKLGTDSTSRGEPRDGVPRTLSLSGPKAGAESLSPHSGVGATAPSMNLAASPGPSPAPSSVGWRSSSSRSAPNLSQAATPNATHSLSGRAGRRGAEGIPSAEEDNSVTSYRYRPAAARDNGVEDSPRASNLALEEKEALLREALGPAMADDGIGSGFYTHRPTAQLATSRVKEPASQGRAGADDAGSYRLGGLQPYRYDRSTPSRPVVAMPSPEQVDFEWDSTAEAARGASIGAPEAINGLQNEERAGRRDPSTRERRPSASQYDPIRVPKEESPSPVGQSADPLGAVTYIRAEAPHRASRQSPAQPSSSQSPIAPPPPAPPSPPAPSVAQPKAPVRGAADTKSSPKVVVEASSTAALPKDALHFQLERRGLALILSDLMCAGRSGWVERAAPGVHYRLRLEHGDVIQIEQRPRADIRLLQVAVSGLGFNWERFTPVLSKLGDVDVPELVLLELKKLTPGQAVRLMERRVSIQLARLIDQGWAGVATFFPDEPAETPPLIVVPALPAPLPKIAFDALRSRGHQIPLPRLRKLIERLREQGILWKEVHPFPLADIQLREGETQFIEWFKQDPNGALIKLRANDSSQREALVCLWSLLQLRIVAPKSPFKRQRSN